MLAPMLVRVATLFCLAPLLSHAAPPVDDATLSAFLGERLAEFHSRRIERLQSLELTTVLERKNPYLFRAKNPSDAGAFMADLLDAHLSSQEEGLFGTLLEQTAIFVCERARGGRKSAVEGIDLEFEVADTKTKYLVAVKSGPNWGNSSQIARMRDQFLQARRILGTNAPGGTRIVAVNGCCYGRTANEDKGDYLKLCGQAFWELVSGEPDFHTRLMDLLDREAGRQEKDFAREYETTLARLTAEFTKEFCDDKGRILWDKLVRHNSDTPENARSNENAITPEIPQD